MSSPAAISPSRNICVFCASANGIRPEYRAVAEDLGRQLALQNIGLIYGGARVGLMGAVADATLGAGGRVTGVIPHVLVDMEVAHHEITELHIVKTMHDRKALMGEKADAFLILPGGFGTLEELFEVLAWSTLKLHSKPIVLLNTAKFWDGMLAFLDHCIAEGVLTQPRRELLLVADTVDEAIRLCLG
ncbi:TIGR00730 family Rossman fold protein [Terriglobus albidus]|uniref:Cytokinin riboside 5'-monophosphate phosphoribohydrolase n=1 Tax=Terriglobus albidus TaxID=1592106 RepID=A0A5B9E6U5_9BACT|nr:TIGR00730 family Rossman fold protein [Terriglobus albidus]QEE27748.1 TIGR00730 family Rossman fold protein [Terriglobus albidus]